ncbi:MAG TPA: hypothetical protein VFV38_51465 [Ktedonobacteraceae bacterium]|nr:hypothetical protein [Ktedonobacteraceae bacterium]
MLDLQEALQASVDGVSQRLAYVISRTHLPRSKDVTALLHACARLKALLPRLEELPEQHEYLLRMQIQNLPDHLARLEKEAQVLFQEAKQQRSAYVVSALIGGGLAVSVCSSLGCLAVLCICLLTGSVLMPTALLCMVALASTMPVGLLGYWNRQDQSKLSATRILLEQRDMVERQGQVLTQHLREVQETVYGRGI